MNYVIPVDGTISKTQIPPVRITVNYHNDRNTTYPRINTVK